MTVPMAIVDFIPVMFFLLAAIRLQRGLYSSMSKGAFALFSGGTIMVFCAGVFKALWKLLIALNICDFERLNYAFFPMQSVGFLLAGIGVIAMVFFRQESKQERLYAAGPAVFSGTFIFVGAMVLGVAGMCGGLAVYSKRRKKSKAIPFFILAFIFMLMMGYLSSRDFEKRMMNWIGEIVNIFGQCFLWLGARILTADAE